MIRRALLAIACAAGLALGGQAAFATTTPGQIYPVKVVITDRKITVAHDNYIHGAIILYRIQNLGTKPYVFEMFGTRTAVIPPGKKDTLLTTWNYQGKFLYRTLIKGAPAGPQGYIRICKSMKPC